MFKADSTISFGVIMHADRQTDKQKHRQTESYMYTDRQTDRQQTDKTVYSPGPVTIII